MKKLFVLGLAVALGTTAFAQAFGRFRATLTWNAYPDTTATGIRCIVSLLSAPSENLTNVDLDITNTSFDFIGDPKVAYRATLTPFASDGRQGPTTVSTWTNPGLLQAITGFRPAVVIYVP